MENKDLILFLNIQIDEIDDKINKNNYENVKLRMNKLHLTLAIERLENMSNVKIMKERNNNGKSNS